MSVSLFGGTTPLATAGLIKWAQDAGYGWAEDIPAFYLMLAAVIGLVAVYFTKETAASPLMGSGPTVGSEDEVAGVIDDYNDPTSELAQSDWAKEFSTSQIPIVNADGPVGDGARQPGAEGLADAEGDGGKPQPRGPQRGREHGTDRDRHPGDGREEAAADEHGVVGRVHRGVPRPLVFLPHRVDQKPLQGGVNQPAEPFGGRVEALEL